MLTIKNLAPACRSVSARGRGSAEAPPTSRMRAVLANQRCARSGKAGLLRPLRKCLRGAFRWPAASLWECCRYSLYLSKQNLIMAPTGRKGTGRPGRRVVKDQDREASGTEDKKDLSGSEPNGKEEGKSPVTDKDGRKRPSAGSTEEELGAEVENMFEILGGDITKALLEKRRRLETNTNASLKLSNQKVENAWKTEKEQRQDRTVQCSQQLSTFFQQWDTDVQKAEEQEQSLTNLFREQQKIFQHYRIVQGQRLKAIKMMYEQFVKSLEDLEKSYDSAFDEAQSELKEELALLQKKLLMDTHQEEVKIVRESLKSLIQ
ncbi:synaptonemal complex protein 3-like isoform X1 [Loxodonta africana]|uniref:synaptonemal complex protein 3-like isoform X1 n=1 Tax=Loxodonta africana TaxID=9785 RepID=UPI0030CA5CD8